MPKRDERQKASDVFRESNFLFGRKVSFNEAFPEIEDVTVDIEEVGYVALKASALIRKAPWANTLVVVAPYATTVAFQSALYFERWFAANKPNSQPPKCAKDTKAHPKADAESGTALMCLQ